MDTIVERPGALDVHKAQVTACVRTPAAGGGREAHFAEFPTTVAGLLTLRDWLAAHGVTQVTMEATGVYWKPVYYVLEDALECWLLVEKPLRLHEVTDNWFGWRTSVGSIVPAWSSFSC